MPWREICPMEERAQFIIECIRGDLSMTALCRKYGISRKTAYKWWDRFEAEGSVRLADRSRACHSHPNATAPEVITLLIAVRKRHPSWGARKLLAWLAERYPGLRLPAPSTAGDVLRAVVRSTGRPARRPARTAPPGRRARRYPCGRPLEVRPCPVSTRLRLTHVGRDS